MERKEDVTAEMLEEWASQVSRRWQTSGLSILAAPSAMFYYPHVVPGTTSRVEGLRPKAR